MVENTQHKELGLECSSSWMYWVGCWFQYFHSLCGDIRNALSNWHRQERNRKAKRVEKSNNRDASAIIAAKMTLWMMKFMVSKNHSLLLHLQALLFFLPRLFLVYKAFLHPCQYQPNRQQF